MLQMYQFAKEPRVFLKDWQRRLLSARPNATTFTNKAIGEDSKPTYTNFVDILDGNNNEAKFIGSTDVVLDNEVLVRYTVK